jgi:hypothetical protein
VICDATRAHLFFTSLDGQMWRSETKLGDFPAGWSRPAVVLRGDIFEASPRKVAWSVQRGANRKKLDAKRYPLNARHLRWTDSFSHGELIRDGFDQTLTVDPNNLRFLFQGVTDQDKAGKKYGEISWRLGVLTAVQ